MLGKKDISDILREQMLRERAATLAKAGEALQGAIDKMRAIDSEIALQSSRMRRSQPMSASMTKADINEMIDRYNEAHKYAQLRLYYLIVTREALGLRRHKTVEEFFQIGAKKKHIG